jgi:hypothetical protein
MQSPMAFLKNLRFLGEHDILFIKIASSRKLKPGIGRRLKSSELKSPNQSKKHLRLIVEQGLRSGQMPLLKK